MAAVLQFPPHSGLFPQTGGKFSTGTPSNNKGQKGNEQISILFELENYEIFIVQLFAGFRP